MEHLIWMPVHGIWKQYTQDETDDDRTLLEELVTVDSGNTGSV